MAVVQLVQLVQLVKLRRQRMQLKRVACLVVFAQEWWDLLVNM